MSLSETPRSAVEIEERERLADVHDRLQRALDATAARIRDYARDIEEQKTYLSENRDEMDHIEKIASRESIEQSVRSGDFLLEKKKRIQKLQRSPYFGRFDVAHQNDDGGAPVYIGIHHFFDDAARENVVYDWRAPIATLFYDYETGPARYDSPEGEVDCTIELKRQFRISGDEIQLMIDSAVHVVDDVLQEELSRSSDEGMKNIVATIQRDQNRIVRDDEAQELIIQGVAGSGKTSIALHRIAFLLYRFKDTLTSDDILIISPNRVFADYISNVLPELGEETVNETSMEAVADELLDGQYRFQTFFEQTAALLEKDDEAMKRRLEYKASPDFLKQLDRYAAHVERTQFQAEDVWVSRRLVPAWLLDEIFRKHRSMPGNERIRQVVREVEQKVGNQYNYDLMPDDRKNLKAAVEKMFQRSTLRETYKGFYTWIGEPDLFRTVKNSKLEYADVFPLIYLKMKLEGIRSPYRKVKHLLIDEMQDYTPVQYAVIDKLFNCRKTILGDANQSVNPCNASTSEDIGRAFRTSARVTLNKSYRSSYEIMQFAQRISPNPDLEPIERHGEEPRVLACGSRAKELEAIRAEVAAFTGSDFNTLGVICKTQKQARRTYEALQGHADRLHLLTEESRSFARGVIVCTAHMAKGLEFDQVIVPEANATNYQTPMDRNLLYVACTRAMHRLVLTHSGAVTPFV
ncbi:HelD family protein [Halofilum ochraceum]|uniref:HelD family protein n=1 Tax=Halofilum ochraceum TaxID=1611323 RepID=UPI0008296F56|nr:3'-5' exonuclease [Halofilum ochraceum]